MNNTSNVTKNLINMYYLATIPVVSCNIFFYSVNLLSQYITSTSNVFKFIYENKDSDYIIYKNELKNLDLVHKMNIINHLVFDTIKKYIPEKNKYNLFIQYINEIDDFTKIDTNYETDIIEKIDKPILYSILSIIEALNNIDIIINNIKNKIDKHQKIYFKHFFSLCLKNEMSQLKFYMHILDIRYNMYIDLLKIYLPNIRKSINI